MMADLKCTHEVDMCHWIYSCRNKLFSNPYSSRITKRFGDETVDMSTV